MTTQSCNQPVAERLSAVMLAYINPSIVTRNAADVQRLDDFVRGIMSNPDFIGVGIDQVLQTFAHHLAENSAWEFDPADDPDAPCWTLTRWATAHSRVMFVARIDLLSRTWCAYVFPVAGINHEVEVCAWRTEGAAIDPKHAGAIFHCPWFAYKY